MSIRTEDDFKNILASRRNDDQVRDQRPRVWEKPMTVTVAATEARKSRAAANGAGAHKT
jgi:hypothetical protein